MNTRRKPGHGDLRWIVAFVSEPWTWIFIGSIVLLLAALIQPRGDAVSLEGNSASPPATVGLRPR